MDLNPNSIIKKNVWLIIGLLLIFSLTSIHSDVKKTPPPASTMMQNDWSKSFVTFNPSLEKKILAKIENDGRPIMIVTDTWEGQKNGVLTVLKALQKYIPTLTNDKVGVVLVTPDQFTAVPLNFQDLLISFAKEHEFNKLLELHNPQSIHIATEGSLGVKFKQFLVKKGLPFTTAYHTMSPEYVSGMGAKYGNFVAKNAERLMYDRLRNFHKDSFAIMVPSKSVTNILIQHGFQKDKIRHWSLGVETDLFIPENRSDIFKDMGFIPPISLFVGRVALEKNLDDFLQMEIPGTKVIIGSGPEETRLQKAYPHAKFLGRKDHHELPVFFASADLFVFTSVKDNFPLVLSESLSCGTAVLAYNVQGPKDVLTSPKVGCLVEYCPSDQQGNITRLENAWYSALTLDRKEAREFTKENSWRKCALEFLYFQVPLP